MLDSKIRQLQIDFSIHSLDDWRRVKPEWILQRRGIGPKTLNLLRLFLAAKNITLEDDATPEHWQKHLDESRIVDQLSDEDAADVCPFVVLVDSQEKQPFTFQGMKTDADQGNRPLIVPTEWKGLGVGKGDYSLAGHEGHVHVERKSMEDAHGTILGWGERRERFVRELEFLSSIECGAVVLECTFGQLINNAPSRGKKSASENAKILHRQVLAWLQDFRVPWIPCDGRRLAEITTFRLIERYWRKGVERAKGSEKREAVKGESEKAAIIPPHDEQAAGAGATGATVSLF